MSQIDKLIDKFQKSPTTIKYRDLRKILKYIGFDELPAKGSHVKFKYSGVASDIIIPVHSNECKDFYKQQTLKIIKNLL